MSDDNAKISVIATRLPFTDRRALSEAWFSALHLASSDAPSAAYGKGAEAPANSDPHAALARRGDRNAVESTAQRAPRRVPREDIGRAALVDGETARPQPSRLAKERDAFARSRSYDGYRTSLTFGVDGERVALVLRREGATLHVVALCRPGVADIVRRALARADHELRARGESIRASVTALAPGDAA